MNKNDKVLIGRLDERVKNMHEDIKEIKNSMSKFHNTIKADELSIARIDTKLANHLSGHSINMQISRRNWAMISGFAAAISAGIAGLSLLILTIIA